VQVPPLEAEGGVAVPKVKAVEESRRGRRPSPQTTEKQVAVEEVKVLKESRIDSGGGQRRPSALGAEVAVEEAVQAVERGKRHIKNEPKDGNGDSRLWQVDQTWY
jgi:hypothetical protein